MKIATAECDKASTKQVSFSAAEIGSDLPIFIVLSLVALLMFSSSWNDSPTYDEPDQVTAGLLSLKYQDFWMNPWQPPLSQDLAALPLLLSPHVNPPEETIAGQRHKKKTVHSFFYEAGNDAQNLIRLARFPFILFSLLFAYFYYRRLKREFGYAPACLAFTMLVSCPTFLAHSRFATTDVLSAGAFFLCTALFSDFLRSGGKKRYFLVSIATGFAMLVKFSLAALLPFYLVLAALFAICEAKPAGSLRQALRIIAGKLMPAAILPIISLSIVALFYQLHILHMPVQYQTHYNQVVFQNQFQMPAPEIVQAMQGISCLRGLSWYLTGLLAQTFHIGLGHPSDFYLLGQFYDHSNLLYFPLLYLTKETLGFILLAALSITLGLCALIAAIACGKFKPSLAYLQEHPFVLCSVAFVLLYGSVAVASKLNIGIRHILPIFPFLYFLVAHAVFSFSRNFGKRSRLLVLAATGLLALWGALSSLLSWPGYLAYFNEVGGGRANGYIIALDSNYDWGQDLLRLSEYLSKQKIARAYVSYFGGGDPAYYLGSRYRQIDWILKPPHGALVAVSATYWRRLLRDARDGEADGGAASCYPLVSNPEKLDWFTSLTPIGKVGDSIFLFRAP
jgi:hypothetical protein